MAKHRFSPKNLRSAVDKGEQLSEEAFQSKFQNLLKQQKYRQALEEIKRIQRPNPEIALTPSEASI